MRIIHTADWHLGQRFNEFDRREEHDAFLVWLLQQLQIHTPDVLIVAGDVFDNGSPPAYALKQYYDFLGKAIRYCPNLVVVGGNHDSPNVLNAPRQLVHHFNIHIVGAALPNIADEIIPIRNVQGTTLGAVAAAPFLRDQDIRAAAAAEQYEDRIQRIKSGIQQHYAALADAVQHYADQNLPIVATGHLFAAGSSEASDIEKDIYIGNKGRIEATIFLPIFNYVALGHIHRPQIVNQNPNIRYCGSPIPLSFSERDENKHVLLVDVAANSQNNHILELPVPLYRPLRRFSGDWAAINRQIAAFEHPSDLPAAWCEAVVQLDSHNYHPHLESELRNLATHKNMILLTIRLERQYQASLSAQVATTTHLKELTPIEVFCKKCEQEQIDLELQPELRDAFLELLESMQEDEKE